MSASHAIFAPPPMDRHSACTFTQLAVTDTIPIGTRADALKDRLVTLSVADLIGDAIHRIHHNESVSALFKGDPGDR
jgi:ribose-phosphate pyrophosphokinase